MKLYALQAMTVDIKHHSNCFLLTEENFRVWPMDGYRVIGTIEVEPKKTEREEIVDKFKNQGCVKYKDWDIFLEKIENTFQESNNFFITARFYQEHITVDHCRQVYPLKLERHGVSLVDTVTWLCDKIDEMGPIERIIFDPKKTVTKEAMLIDDSEFPSGRSVEFGVPKHAKNIKCIYEVEE
jgi:hypothetical protein